MKGFADYALVLLSERQKYMEASGLWRNQYVQALDNLIKYLHRNDIWIRFLATDPLAQLLLDGNELVEWQATENTGGMYFLNTQGGVPRHQYIKLPTEVEEAMNKKFPIERGLNTERRMYLTDKRVALAEKSLIGQAQCVFCFGKLFRPKSSPEDGRAIISINNQFIPSLKLSGYDTSPSLFFDATWGNLSLTEWGRYLDG